jgi:glycosyltransferase involved in cell wall biosynthesis
VKPMDSVVEHERNGLLVAPGNSQELYNAASRLYADRDLWEYMRIEARQTYERLYMPSANFRALLDIYKGALTHAVQPIRGEV